MFFTNQNFVTNRIEVWGLLLDLACNTAEAKEQRLSGIEASETCKYKSGNLNGMREYVLKIINFCSYGLILTAAAILRFSMICLGKVG